MIDNTTGDRNTNTNIMTHNSKKGDSVLLQIMAHCDICNQECPMHNCIFLKNLELDGEVNDTNLCSKCVCEHASDMKKHFNKEYAHRSCGCGTWEKEIEKFGFMIDKAQKIVDARGDQTNKR